MRRLLKPNPTGVLLLVKEDGTGWAQEPRENLASYRTEPAEDLECCETGRILKAIRARQPLAATPSLASTELGALESEVLSLVHLERGGPGYDHALRLRGVLATGRDAKGARMAFASFSGGEVSNDHYAAYEVFWRRDGTPEVMSITRYYGDVAGIEGFTAWRVALVLTILGVLLLPALLVLWAAGRALVLRVGWHRAPNTSRLAG